MVKRLWRTVKYDDVHIRAFKTMGQLREGLECFFRKYNNRPHQELGGISPLEAYSRRSGRKAA